MTDIALSAASNALDTDAFRDRMQDLQQRFVTRTRQDAGILRALRARWDGGEDLSGALLKDLLHTVHGLSGAAGIFGFETLSEAAHLLECSLRCPEGDADEPRAAFDRLDAALSALLADEAAEAALVAPGNAA